MADIARVANVSVSTVSRALSGRGDLPPGTRVRIQRVASELGYARPGNVGRPVASDPRLIELLLGVFHDGWAGEVTEGARAGAAALGYDLVLTQEREDPDDDWPLRVAARRSSGVVLGLIRPTRAQLSQLRGFAIPIVLLDPISDPDRTLLSIGTTDWQGGYDAGSHLAGLRLDRFVVVNGEPRFRFGKAREDGFRQAIRDRCDAAEIVTVRGDWQDGALTNQLEHLLAPGDRVGVFACNDAMAVGVYRAARRLRLSVPKDVSVVGFDDAPLSASLVPPLTTVRQPIRAMAARAVELIHQARAGDPPATERVEVPTELVVRRSTRQSPTP